MSVENMTLVSLFLLSAAGILAAAAAVMFFVFDIPRCLRMVSGKAGVRGPKKASVKKSCSKRRRVQTFQKSGRGGQTLLLDADVAGDTLRLKGDTGKGTLVLDGGQAKKTPLPGMEIVQDIAYKDDGTIPL